MVQKLNPWSLGNLATFFNAVKQAATTTLAGVVELATNAEVQAGTDTERAVTPAGLASRTATTTRTGVVELATNAEAIAGTDTERAVTPAGMKAHTDTLSSYPAPRVQTKTSGTSIDFADIEVVVFNYAAPATITTFSNAVVGKIYMLVNTGSSTITIDRTAAHLNGSTNQSLTVNDVMLVQGMTTTAIRQVAPVSVNG